MENSVQNQQPAFDSENIGTVTSGTHALPRFADMRFDTAAGCFNFG